MPNEVSLADRLTDEEVQEIVYLWGFWARDEQLPPPGDWVTWLLMGGRGSGKTRAGAEWVRGLASAGVGPIALVGETITEAVAVMIEGPSGVMAVTPPDERPKLSGATLHWPNGVVGTILGASDPERFRGPQFAAAWSDELGCGAVDKGANQPNVFTDPKSAESAKPYFSSGVPDALAQRQVLRAALSFWDDSANNPTSSVYHAPMVGQISLWTWDARPYPAFPTDLDVWSDGANYPTGHWLNGRAGAMAADEMARAIATDFGVTLDRVDAALPFVQGYVVDAPMSARDALAPLLAAAGLDIRDTPEGLSIARTSGRDAIVIVDVVATDGAMISRRRPDPGEAVGQVALSYADRERDYLNGSVTAIPPGAGQLASVGSGLVLDLTGARNAAERLLADKIAQRDTVQFTAPPSLAALEAGDAVEIGGDLFQITELRDGLARSITALSIVPAVAVTSAGERPGAGGSGATPPAEPVLAVAQLPPAIDDFTRSQLAIAAFARPWPGEVTLTEDSTGASLATLTHTASLGELTVSLAAGGIFLWDTRTTVELVLYSGHLSSRDDDEVLAGANRIAVESDAGEWEVIGFADANLIAPQTYRLSRLLRGQMGTDHAIGTTSSGNRVVVLDNDATVVPLPATWLGTTVDVRSFAGRADAVGTLSEVATTLAPILPLAPCHLRAVRAAGSNDIALTWVRRSRADADSWTPDDAPLDCVPEAYRLTIHNGVTLVRTMDSLSPGASYTSAQQTADFGAPPSTFTYKVAQKSPVYGPGNVATAAFAA
jgi:GTA TIM-barrel-like domain/Putative phage tail protein/Terminase large subunit, T4likevirus-type, N-terminal